MSAIVTDKSLRAHLNDVIIINCSGGERSGQLTEQDGRFYVRWTERVDHTKNRAVIQYPISKGDIINFLGSDRVDDFVYV